MTIKYEEVVEFAYRFLYFIWKQNGLHIIYNKHTVEEM